MSLRFRGSLAAPAGSLCALLLATTAMPAFAADNTTPSAPTDAAPAADGDQNVIVVTGVREAELRAIEAKRKADNVTETLMANDVGKLPDQNVAEAVKRLPGITVANDQGEGRYVTIRGASPNLTNVTVNGQTAPAPEPDGRQVKLDDIPSSLIGSVVVHKTLTADLDANAIAGQVDINTLTAFDRNKPFVYARAAAGINDLSGRVPYEFEGTAGSQFGSGDQFGAVISGNYSKRPIRSQNIQGSSNWVGGVPDDFRMRDYNLTRERWGLVGNFDWKPSDSAHLFLRTLYSTFKDHETRDQYRIEKPAASSHKSRGSRLIRLRNEDDSTLNIQTGGNFDFGGAKLDVEGTYAKAIKKDPLRSEYNFRTDSNALTGVTTDLSDFLFTVTTDNGNDPTLFKFNSVNYEHRRAEENLYQGRIDLTLPLAGLGDDSSVKVGAKYLQRDKTNDINSTIYNAAKGVTTTLAQSGAAQFTGVSLYDGRYFFGPVVDHDLADAYFAANPSARTVNAADTLGDSVLSDYDISEKIWAGYAMATLRFGNWSIIPGVRVEHTDGDYRAKAIDENSTVDPGFNVGVKHSYTDWFPGLNVKYEAGDKLVVRAAVTTAIGRPDYSQLAPYVQVDTNEETVAMGNPNLKPYKSINGDLSVEYYLPGHGLLSAAFFYKDIDNPIYEQVVTQSGTFGGHQIDDAEVDTFVNADHAKLYGFELNAQVQATFLPSPWDGFGVGANYSHTWGSGNGLPNRAGDFPLFGQSADVASAQLFYEKGRVAMRVAWSYRSAYLDGLGDTAEFDQYTGGNGQLDARASFALTRNATIFFEGTNLTDAPWRRYQAIKTQLIENERYSYTAKGGIQFAF